jgi:hypothetical protein
MLQQANPGTAGQSLRSGGSPTRPRFARERRRHREGLPGPGHQPSDPRRALLWRPHITHAGTDPRVAGLVISRPARMLCRIRLHVEAENLDPKPVEAPQGEVDEAIGAEAGQDRANEFATFVPEGGTVPQAVLTDGRRPMFRSMRHASLRLAKSRRRSLWTSVHSHSRTSLRTRR